MPFDTNTLLRSLPAMDELLNTPWAAGFSAAMGRDFVKKTIAEVLAGIRGGAIDGAHTKAQLGELVENRASALLRRKSSSTLRHVVNATGVVIHTNLGRAPLSGEAQKAVNDIAGTYSTLEYSPEKGVRGGRNSHIEWLICHITGAQAALVVNNNAAAVLLALSATARGREVIVSNGELVEIGDSFRIPDILSFSGATMVAVGCTNSTRIADYRDAITENTAVLLKVHPSNYRIDGFTASTGRDELAELASSRGLAFIEDLGSGLLCPLGVTFAHLEHSVRDCIEAGVGAVTFSGDKLLGGPQIGVIAGEKQLVDRMRSHQLLRALRIDKMTLAAFEATLRMYVAGRHGEIPVVKMIETDRNAMLKKAQRLSRMLRQKALDAGAGDVAIDVVETDDAIGGGAFPTQQLAGVGVGIRCASLGAVGLALAFRTGHVPVIPGIRDGRVVLHVRTLLDGNERIIADSFAGILGKAV
ncbi:MAG: L-seryl-tRNA(Sec) selenium transferase [Treponema sp.]|nr:L-seryl-tRNA(Sec) selenium transferase [Treponema sp.]